MGKSTKFAIENPGSRQKANEHLASSQAERFIAAARELGCDDDEAVFNAKLRAAATTRGKPPAVAHRSDCAVHNEPAMAAGPCDCGATKPER